MSGGASLPSAGTGRVVARFERLIFPLALVAAVMVVLVPLPVAVMDLLLSANITLAVVVLLTTVYVRRPLEFSVFPSVLLATTLLRLVLNVASTRLILTRGAEHGTLAAGAVIRSFGEFVAGDKVAVGIILFLILIVIQFVVITKGATRISEVAARFALDGLPGRQMAIDADLNAGSINEPEARRQRQELTHQADFYAAMDGASKFVRGDAIAALLIIGVNILGGLYMGVIESGMGLVGAVGVYTKLTIGDGLVTQLPAVLISLAAAFIVTRSSSEGDLPRQMVGQLIAYPQALGVAAVFLVLLSFTRLPQLPLIFLGICCGGIAHVLARHRAPVAPLRQRDAATQPVPRRSSESSDYQPVELLEVEIGFGLIGLVDPQRGGDLLHRIQRMRDQIRESLGLMLPKVRVRDNLRLRAKQYRIKIRGVPAGEGVLYPDRWLAISPPGVSGELPGIPADERSLGGRAWWILEEQRPGAQSQGYEVVIPTGALVRHLEQVVQRHADELLSREQVKQLLDRLKLTSPALVDEVVPAVVRYGDVQRVLANLLRERVPIRDLETILEVLSLHVPRTKDPDILSERVREALGRTLCQQYCDPTRTLHVVSVEPELEERLIAAGSFDGRGIQSQFGPSFQEHLIRRLALHVGRLTQRGRPAVVLCRAAARPVLKRLTVGRLPELAVLSYAELTSDTRVETVSTLQMGEVVTDSQEATNRS